jgi:hypothetical protein
LHVPWASQPKALQLPSGVFQQPYALQPPPSCQQPYALQPPPVCQQPYALQPGGEQSSADATAENTENKNANKRMIRMTTTWVAGMSATLSARERT